MIEWVTLLLTGSKLSLLWRGGVIIITKQGHTTQFIARLDRFYDSFPPKHTKKLIADLCESSFTMHWHAVYDKWYLYSPLWRKYNWNSLLHHLGNWSCNMAVAPAHRHTIYNCTFKQLWNMCLFSWEDNSNIRKNRIFL